MNEKALRDQAFEANLALVKHGLVVLTWGNASAREGGVMAIKPSGLPYAIMKSEDMVLVDIETGQVVEKTDRRPSSDTPTHCRLYQAFASIGGVIHTHSKQASAWAQAGSDLPCYGTTHADYFYGTIPCTPAMTADEIDNAPGYEWNTGEVIVREFQRRNLDALDMSAVLVRGHAPFVWGKTAAKAVENALVLEEVAGMALDTLRLNASAPPISKSLLDKHFKRKHGPGAYYGQKQP
jgi:L-ribulose-5-phosphate 4-epimerase